MNWRLPAGVLGVLVVAAIAVGSILSFAGPNDLIVGGGENLLPAALSAIIVAAGIAVTIYLARPSPDWFGNPYW